MKIWVVGRPWESCGPRSFSGTPSCCFSEKQRKEAVDCGSTNGLFPGKALEFVVDVRAEEKIYIFLRRGFCMQWVEEWEVFSPIVAKSKKAATKKFYTVSWRWEALFVYSPKGILLDAYWKI